MRNDDQRAIARGARAFINELRRFYPDVPKFEDMNGTQQAKAMWALEKAVEAMEEMSNDRC